MVCRTKRFHFKGNPSSAAEGTWASSYANTTGSFRTPGNERSVVERPSREIAKGFGSQLFTEKISRSCVLPAGLIEKKKKEKGNDLKNDARTSDTPSWSETSILLVPNRSLQPGRREELDMSFRKHDTAELRTTTNQ